MTKCKESPPKLYSEIVLNAARIGSPGEIGRVFIGFKTDNLEELFTIQRCLLLIWISLIFWAQ